MGERFLDRREAAAYLTDELGLRVSRNSLQKWATIGGGPAYRLFGIRAVYTVEDLDAWASAKLSPPRHSTSEISPAAPQADQTASGFGDESAS